MDKININLYSLLTSMSNAQGLISSKLANHHQQVSYMAFRLAEQLQLPIEEQYDLFIAGLIHDIGALSIKERFDIIESSSEHIHVHAFRGAKLIGDFKPLQKHAKIIKFHHVPWENGNGMTFRGEDVPLSSHIMNLADRISAAIKYDSNILTQVPRILEEINSKSGSVFHPDHVEALFALSKKEYIWLDLISKTPAELIASSETFDILKLDIDELIELSLVFSRFIDFRSRFTAVHSAGVAKTAEKLAELMNFSPYECKMMLVAGYLHDLGKITISDAVLEKPAQLNEYEFNEMRAHTYYTYRLLEPIEELKTINAWASFHHEKLNGKGYPFKLNDKTLTLGSRIMAVADVFTAITEDRPYRKGMDYEQATKVLTNLVNDYSLDEKVVNTLLDHYEKVNNIRIEAQAEAEIHYQEILNV